MSAQSSQTAQEKLMGNIEDWVQEELNKKITDFGLLMNPRKVTGNNNFIGEHLYVI